MKYDVRNIISVVSAALLVIANSCANIQAPAGGPKDTAPPRFISSEPVSGAKNVKTREFTINFDEFIVMKDIQDHLLISPPQNTPPEIQARKKQLKVILQDSLRPNTTYNINFGNSITDLNEGNPLKAFSYVFSSGNSLDSMQLCGKIQNALSLEPIKDALVLLYDHIGDSVPFKEIPSYVCRSDNDGSFQFYHLADKSYHIIALKEKNRNMLYDDRQEEIGFLDTLIKPAFRLPDSLFKDSILKMSSIPQYNIFLSTEKDTVQRLKKWNLLSSRELNLIFQAKVNQLDLSFLNKTQTFEYLQEFNINQDSVKLWITSDNIPDSAFLIIKADNRILDTIEINMKKPERRTRQGKDAQKMEKLTQVNTIPEPGENNLLRIIFSNPIRSFHKNKILLFNSNDSILGFQAYFEDSIHRKLVIKHQWQEAKPYKIIVADSAFFGYGNQTNDSIKIMFTSPALKDYAQFKVKCKNNESKPIHYELLSSTGVLIASKDLTGSGDIVFEYLKPGKYKLRAIKDNNNNGQWDPGSYINKQLPEEVSYFPRELDIRANWEFEEEWDF